jgi:hypothetical protein
MPSTYSSNLRLELIASGEQANTWGNTTNTNLGTLLESSIAGRVELSSGWASNSLTLSAFNGANDQSRQMCLVVPAITISANSTIIVPASAVTSTSGKLYTVINKSLSYSVTIKLAATTGVTIPANTAKTVIYNGTDFQEAFTALDLLTLTGTPTTAVHAVNKGYVDNKFFSLADNNTVTGNTSFTGTVALPTATPTGNQATSYNYVNANYLWKAAGVTSQIMNPFLRLNYTPTDPADAVHKAYVDANFVGISNVQTISGAKTFSGSVSLSGAATLTLANAPVSNMQASTKQYVDDSVNAAIGSASNTFALKSTTVYAGTGIQINGTSFGTLGNDLTISVVGGGTVTSVTATAPLAVTGSTAVNLSMPPATSSANGYLLATDWYTFDNKCNANGSNASGGAWNISILGNAATASSVAWTSVSGRPTDLSSFTNGPGYLSSVSYGQVSGAPTKLSQFSNDTGFVNGGYVDAQINALAVSISGDTMTGNLAISSNFTTNQYISGVFTDGSGNYFPGVAAYRNATGSNYSPFVIVQTNNSGPVVRYNLTTAGAHLFVGNLSVTGNLSATGTKPFCIDHPVLEDKKLYHVAVEAPRNDLLYRGKVKLAAGQATVNLDSESRMTAGTFVALTQNVEVVGLNNASGFGRIRASAVVNGQFTIYAEEADSTDEVNWVVMAERNDNNMHGNTLCDEYGRLVPEQDKEEE